MINTAEKPTKLLLHACCGPCSLEPVRLLRERGIEPHIFYSNSNIYPDEEYNRRLETIKSWTSDEAICFIEDDYNPDVWQECVGTIGDETFERFGIIAGTVEDENTENKSNDDESVDTGNANNSNKQTDITHVLPTHSQSAENARQARCRACYRLRLERSAQYAAENGFDTLGTTLSVSPYQYTDILEKELERACTNAGIQALFEDYRPYYPEATRRAREAGMYRQNYCGCRFSQTEAGVDRLARKKAHDIAKQAKRAETAAKQAAVQAQQAAKKAERAAYEEKQARKHAVLKSIRMKNKDIS